MSELNITALFPTFLFFKDYPNPTEFNARLLDEGNLLREMDPEGASISNRGGWQSKEDINTYPQFAPLVRFVEDTMAEVKEFLGVTDDAMFRVGSAWVNFNARGDYNTRHIHSNSFFSAVYYVKVPENSGEFHLFDPNPVRTCFHVPYKESTAQNTFIHGVKPVEGRLLVFPSYVFHEVTANMSDEERCSIALNIGIR